MILIYLLPKLYIELLTQRCHPGLEQATHENIGILAGEGEE